MPPTAVSLFNLRQLLALFVGKLGSHLAMRVTNDPVNLSTGVSPDLTELSSCFIDDRRNFRELFRGEIEFVAEPFFHASADPFGMMQLKEVIPRVRSPHERASDSPRHKHQQEPRDQFPLQCAVHFKTHPGSPNPRWRIHSSMIRGFRGSVSLREPPRLLI